MPHHQYTHGERNTTMKRIFNHSLLYLTMFTSLQAAEPVQIFQAYQGYIWITAVFLLAILVYLTLHYKNALNKLQMLTKEKDEKIQWLRRVSAENDQRNQLKIQELEKQVTQLTHQIEILEQKSKEGTKNQVVAKIEEMQHKRARVLDALLSAYQG